MRNWAPIAIAVLAFAPSALAVSTEGTLVVDAPVEGAGGTSVTGSGIVLYHQAYEADSFSGSIYTGQLIQVMDRELLSRSEMDCVYQINEERQEQTVFLAEAGQASKRITFNLAEGAHAVVAFDGSLNLTARQGTVADDADSVAALGPNPYVYVAGGTPFTGEPGDAFAAAHAAAIPQASFIVVPRSTVATTDAYRATVQWGDLQAKQGEGPVSAYKWRQETRTETAYRDPAQLLPVDCFVRVTTSYVLQASFATLQVGQQGADRADAFWSGEEAQPPSGGHPTSRGWWPREQGRDLGAALIAFHLPNTVIAGDTGDVARPFAMNVDGITRLERALGSLGLQEARDQAVRLLGTFALKPVETQDGRRMSLDVSGDGRSDIAGLPARTWTDDLPMYAASFGLASFVGLAYFWPRLKFLLAQGALFPLYARLKKEDILENPLRDDILEAVGASPGISASDLGRRLSCGWGTLVYHLTVLERMQLISSAREGRHRRFFVQGRINYSDKDAVGLLANVHARTLLDAIRGSPGLIQRDLGRVLGLSAGTIAWHVERMEQAGLVVRETEGRVVRYYPSQKLLELTKQLAA